MAATHPLVFQPILKPKPWGGRRLETVLGKTLPAGAMIGESWELADLEGDQSAVARGPCRGQLLGQLVREWRGDLLGNAPLIDGRFPLLIKFLDASESLSIQVHPDAGHAARVGGATRVKHEAWYVIDTNAEGRIYRGALPGTTRETLRDSAAKGDVARHMNVIPARRGHCLYLPSGTLHALGGGVLVAEIQTPSDVTYRLFDWGRIDPATGRPRELHVEAALECVQLGECPINEDRPEHVASVWTAVSSLVRCESFVIERVRMVEGVDQDLPYEEFMIWIVLEGSGTISYKGSTERFTFAAGDTVLIPAGLREGRVQTAAKCMWLEVSRPIASSLAEFERPVPEEIARTNPGGGGWVQLNVPRRPSTDPR